MKFKSRKDALFTIIIYGTVMLLISLSVLELSINGPVRENIWIFGIVLVINIVLLWIYHGTYYKIENGQLKYRSGPIRGKIRLDRIRKIEKGKTMWAGIKPATALHGLIVHYNKYDEIYISPKTNDKFIDQLMEMNSDIEVVE
ncbi:MAG TPA: hypothetical protein DDY13_18985 [Cytophagales bacterium]|jgi:hypothetical protein|nr:hypothetical protein [Cytophagales bacterium]